MSCFTFTWQPKRQFSCCCLRVKYIFSVGKISPPPANTWHLHRAQVPPPPQADGRNIFLLPKVVSRVEPPSASTIFCPLINILTSPEVVSFAFAYKMRPTRNKVKARKTATLAMIVV